MSNKRIELSGTFYVGIVEENIQETDDYQPQDYSKCDTLAHCEYNNMSKLPRFVAKCMALGIKPLCGVSFFLKTPEDCLTDSLTIVCYAEDEEGTLDLEHLYSCSELGWVKYEDFRKYSNHLQVGLNVIFSEVDMIAIENILETVFIPDFVIIDMEQNRFRAWQTFQRILEEKNIPICGGGFPVDCSVDDEIILTEDFDFLGEKAYEYVVENPRKIADRISGNYKFDIALIESIEKKITGGRRRL